MTQTVVGIFNSATDAQNAVDQLLNNGFNNSDVDMKAGNSAEYATIADTSVNDNKNTGGFSNFFKNLFNDNEDESSRYSAAAEKGTVVSVYTQTAEEANRASMILDQYGAIEVDDNDYSTATDMQNSKTNVADTKGNNAGKKISVMEEKLQVGKKEVNTGGMRIKSRIVEKAVEENLRLREEHVSVQRNKVDRTASDADFNNFKEGVIELKEYAEVPVVSKEARVIEEISLDKQVNERKETVRDTVRKTEVDIEQLDGNKN